MSDVPLRWAGCVRLSGLVLLSPGSLFSGGCPSFPVGWDIPLDALCLVPLGPTWGRRDSWTGDRRRPSRSLRVPPVVWGAPCRVGCPLSCGVPPVVWGAPCRVGCPLSCGVPPVVWGAPCRLEAASAAGRSCHRADPPPLPPPLPPSPPPSPPLTSAASKQQSGRTKRKIDVESEERRCMTARSPPPPPPLENDKRLAVMIRADVEHGGASGVMTTIIANSKHQSAPPPRPPPLSLTHGPAGADGGRKQSYG
uniref:Uncharacterized protein n=1 Tax=Knipowitschia caucasica TaxID=637954 RepID=A0AAV2MTG7_KNICA